MKRKLKTFLFVGAVLAVPVVVYSLTPRLTFEQLRVQGLPHADQKLTASMWDDLVIYVENLQIDMKGLQDEISYLKNEKEPIYDQVPLGTIIATNGTISQSTMNADGWALCDGTSISSQVTNADITGYTPNLAGKTLVGVGTFASTTTFNLGDDNIYRYDSSTYLGEVRHTLSVYEMPSHSHGVKWQNADWESGGDRRGDGTIYPQSKSNVTNSTSYIQSAGNGQAHNNMPPFYVVQYYMKVRCSTDSKGLGICGGAAYTYSWYTSSYGTCSVTCGGGTQTRTVYCKRSDGTQVADGNCIGGRPTTFQSCNTQSCGGGGGGGGCFVAGTKILMADGTEKNIEDIVIGEQLLGADGSINTVILPLKIKWENRTLYAINGSKYFVTESHPFMSTNGWKAINVAAAKRENPELEITLLEVGDILITSNNGQQQVENITELARPMTTFVYNFMINGDHTYYADRYLVHNAQEKSQEALEADPFER